MSSENLCCVDSAAPDAVYTLALALYDALTARCNPQTHVPVFVFVGSMLTMGDSVGPRVGDLLRKRHYPGPFVGDPKQSLTSKTLHTVQDRLRFEVTPWHREPFVIAVDASVLRPLDIRWPGCVTVYTGPLHPGSGSGKSLPPFGELCIMAATVAIPPSEAAFGAIYTTLAMRSVPESLVTKLSSVITGAIESTWEMWEGHVLSEYAIASAAQEAD